MKKRKDVSTTNHIRNQILFLSYILNRAFNGKSTFHVLKMLDID